MKFIPVNRPLLTKSDLINVNKTLKSGWISSSGKELINFEKKFSKYIGHKYGVAVSSGTAALDIAVKIAGLKKDDEIIVSALAWSTSIFPLTQYGLKPVFVDCNLKTMNIDIEQVKKAISKKTKGILAIPIYGNPCEMVELKKICKKYNLFLLEDTCESMGAKYNNKFLGGFGLASSFSFYFSHHITCLEGGVTVTNDYELAEIMKIIRSHGWIRNVNKKEAMKMLLTGDMINAKEAKRISLINDEVPDEQLTESVMDLAKKIANKPIQVVEIGKKAFYKQHNLSLSDAYEYTSKVMAEDTLKDDAKEGINSFLEKRDPKWSDK